MLKKETQTEKPDLEKTQVEEKNEESFQEPAAEPRSSEGSRQVSAKEPESSQQEAGQNDEIPVTHEQRIAELETQLADTRDQLLRKAADFENFRKRMNQEKQSSIEYANQSLILDIIPIIDDFERAIQAGESSTDYTGLLEGIKMIEKRLTSQLEAKWGLKRFISTGELFDPNLHEAIMMEKSPDVSEATVQEDFSRGYMLKDRVIRAAKVKVLMPEK